MACSGPHCFLGASAGAAGAGLAAGAAGAGAYAGLTSSLAAGFSGALGLHATPVAAKLTTRTGASKTKIHFFISAHLLSDRLGTPPFFYPTKEPSRHRGTRSVESLASAFLDQQAS
jgi:hypothetical protein